MFTRFITGSCLLASVFLTACAAPPASVKSETALQMYTLRNVGSADEQFAMAHKAGFKNVEIVGTHDLSAAQLRAELQKYQLNVTSSHVQLSVLENQYQETVSFSKAVNNRTLIVPWIDPEHRPDSKQAWIDFAERLNRLGAKLRHDGLQLAYHNHNFEMKKYQGETALDIILQHTQPENLMIELDVAWVSRGGQDPVRFLKTYPGRFYAIHAKDNSSIGIRDDEMNFAPLGEGILDWGTILPAAKQSGVKWFIIEHDKPKDPWSIITTSRKNLDAMLATSPR
ncbi:sugar phosphate isomerase/epimerase [Pantoea alhagi]|uniref:sugar phosphate isomerase/epimerase family protein n=1 Tax=Mixta sp. BE291 TaxID=3158787 RepID=UPI00286097E7|nr:sugar phosphate isomerase/epimerase [Pantoea alhagi]